MKTFDEAILNARAQRPTGKYREIIAETLQSEEMMSMRVAFSGQCIKRLAFAKMEDVEAIISQEIWVAFCAGLVTGIEMEKP